MHDEHFPGVANANCLQITCSSRKRVRVVLISAQRLEAVWLGISFTDSYRVALAQVSQLVK